MTDDDVMRKSIGCPIGGRHLIDGCDAVVGINEQPLPIERNDVDLQRFRIVRYGLPGGGPADRPEGIEHVGRHPCDGAETNDDEKRRRPDDQLQMGRVFPIGLIGRRLVRLAEMPANSTVRTMTGIMMNNIRTVEMMTRSRCWMATSPDGFKTTALQPPSNARSGSSAIKRKRFKAVRVPSTELPHLIR